VAALRRRLATASATRHAAQSASLSALRAQLEAVAPERTLARGYSITLDAQGRPIRDAAAVAPGSEIRTRLERGELRSRTEGAR
jgi:exodeoxyribonuclease VII large subunit